MRTAILYELNKKLASRLNLKLGCIKNEKEKFYNF